jgi:hypothetical protein
MFIRLYVQLSFSTFIKPNDACGVWGYVCDTDVKLLMRLIGFSILSYSVLIISLTYFQEVSYKSVAYSMIPCALSAVARSRKERGRGSHRKGNILTSLAPMIVNVDGVLPPPLSLTGSMRYTSEGDEARASFMTAYAVMSSVTAAFILKECDKKQCGI